MSSITYEPASDALTSNILLLSGIGYTLSAIISSLLLIHILFIFYHISNKPQNDESTTTGKDKVAYTLIIIFLFIIMTTGIIYSSIRSNTLTWFLPFDEFTHYRCLLGVIFGYAFYGSNFVMLNLIFLHRIRSIFTGSTFAYKSWVYHTYFVLILCLILSPITAIIASIQSQSFTVKYDPRSNIAFCTSNPLDFTANDSTLNTIAGSYHMTICSDPY